MISNIETFSRLLPYYTNLAQNMPSAKTSRHIELQFGSRQCLQIYTKKIRYETYCSLWHVSPGHLQHNRPSTLLSFETNNSFVHFDATILWLVKLPCTKGTFQIVLECIGVSGSVTVFRALFGVMDKPTTCPQYAGKFIRNVFSMNRSVSWIW